MGLPARPLADLDDLLRSIREDRACELISGELVEKAAGDERHGLGQAEVGHGIYAAYSRRPATHDDRPGGWWIRTEVDIAFGRDVYRPDLSGWRRERVPVMPEEWPVPVAPDWICEILSRSTASRDLGVKMRGYHAARVGYYWVVDRANEVILVYRWAEHGYQVVQTAAIGEQLRGEPFEAVAIDVGRVFGIETDEPEPEAPGG